MNTFESMPDADPVTSRSPEVENIHPITPSQLHEWPKRKMLLPPDANVHGSSHTLYLLKERVRFKCSCCHRLGIVAELLAYSEKENTIQCTKCYQRLIRPRNFRPLRLHPFPELLTWLTYDPKLREKETGLGKKKDLHKPERPPEAFYPSGERIGTTPLTLQEKQPFPSISFPTENAATHPHP